MGGNGGAYADRVLVNSEQVSLESLEKLVSDFAFLTSAGSSFHHCGAKTEMSCDFVVSLCFLIDGPLTITHIEPVLGRRNHGDTDILDLSQTCRGSMLSCSCCCLRNLQVAT